MGTLIHRGVAYELVAIPDRPLRFYTSGDPKVFYNIEGVIIQYHKPVIVVTWNHNPVGSTTYSPSRVLNAILEGMWVLVEDQ